MATRPLRSVYPDEFEHFVQQIQAEVSCSKFPYDEYVDVIGKVVEVALDPEEVNSKVSRNE